MNSGRTFVNVVYDNACCTRYVHCTECSYIQYNLIVSIYVDIHSYIEQYII